MSRPGRPVVLKWSTARTGIWNRFSVRFSDEWKTGTCTASNKKLYDVNEPRLRVQYIGSSCQTIIPCRNISLIQWISCKFGEFIFIVMPSIIRKSCHVWYWCGFPFVFARSALALIGWEAHMLVLRMREAFRRPKFPALCLGCHV